MVRILTTMVMLVLLVGCYSVCHWKTEKGEKVGFIIKIAKQGVIFETCEATLIRGGINDGSGAFGSAFNFTIENNSLLEKAKQLMKERKEVRITYHKEAFTFLRSESNNYFLDDIE